MITDGGSSLKYQVEAQEYSSKQPEEEEWRIFQDPWRDKEFPWFKKAEEFSITQEQKVQHFAKLPTSFYLKNPSMTYYENEK